MPGKKKKVIAVEYWVKIQCPFCGNYVSLPDCLLPDILKCDMCLGLFKLDDYDIREYKRRK